MHEVFDFEVFNSKWLIIWKVPLMEMYLSLYMYAWALYVLRTEARTLCRYLMIGMLGTYLCTLGIRTLDVN